ncbi:hypothetical protein Ga0123462_1535 [Mariprofundus ferrinatatus]|uniref:Uncharacterized protein n=1 Tax=Mariprofundus ferrinatatus TaxID=1921087 RepID=A0A2K8L504_9PROT|nr:hypothetical protein [Mariprofundus ferrinatatus]ATX82398.1 hypothetical protein Ga0123462_1535 [Mariprofundus ferrinatatus]
MKKSTRVMDIIIFGVCLFGVLILFEYRAEAGDKILWGLGIPLAIIGVFFGFRAANPDLVPGKGDD